MPEGPFGGPRPAAQCNITITLNLTRDTQRRDDLVDIAEKTASGAVSFHDDIVVREGEHDIGLRVIIPTRSNSLFMETEIQEYIENFKSLLAASDIRTKVKTVVITAE